MASRVPNTSQVVPGASVSIVLKADQRTGREVQGVVQNVLTRGDHHRGIKVRLTDGRIGRSGGRRIIVAHRDRLYGRRFISSWRAGPNAVNGPSTHTVYQERGRQRPQYQDVRFDGHFEPPPEQIDLAAYIKPAKQKKKGRKAATDGAAASASASIGEGSNANPAADVVSATATCPVCSAFEGDEAAVAHHVATHFE
ncbi:MFS multidrug transporter [Apiospora saccharicola]|uniref:MFS multidrug transporter n=1 Tax=Apiospora saccharicola TaxID=335842 RepID=A0ABR1UMD1_9PEZI